MAFVLFLNQFIWAREPISGSRFQQLAGVKTSQDSKTQWDERYSRTTFIFGKSKQENWVNFKETAQRFPSNSHKRRPFWADIVFHRRGAP